MNMVELTCRRCSVPFCVPVSVLKNRKRLGLKISCPNGHRHVVYVATDGVISIALPTSTTATRTETNG